MQTQFFARLLPYRRDSRRLCRSYRCQLDGNVKSFIGGIDPPFVSVTTSEAEQLRLLVQNPASSDNTPLFEVVTREQMQVIQRRNREAALARLGRQAGIDPGVLAEATLMEHKANRQQARDIADAGQVRRSAALATAPAAALTAAPAAAATDGDEDYQDLNAQRRGAQEAALAAGLPPAPPRGRRGRPRKVAVEPPADAAANTGEDTDDGVE